MLYKELANFLHIKNWLFSMQSGGQLAAHINELGWIFGSAYIHVPVK